MTEVARWLDGRRPAMPPELRRVVDTALDAAAPDAGTSVPDQLADAALATLARVLAAAPDRATADELLAADALLTYACEAAAEVGPVPLDRLTARLDFSRFASLLESTPS